jgi:GNAT superfamily N-acetyltransferase
MDIAELTPAPALAAHRPDAHWTARAGDKTLARCSLWWREAPPLEGEKLAVIGHFHAEPGAGAAARALLEHACRAAAAQGATLVAGPMDGNTWRAYRLVSDAGREPPFFLEPWTPLEWNEHWRAAGFAPLATYHSALNDDLAQADARVPQTAARLETAGLRLRTLDPGRFIAELEGIYELSAESFTRNYLYTPLSRDEFIDQYRPVERHVDPRFVLIAERGGEVEGFLFALPDLLQAQRGAAVDTLVMKTVAVRPGRQSAGLGAWMVAECHARAARAGLRRAVHALMHDANKSASISRHTAAILRRYTLYSRRP